MNILTINLLFSTLVFWIAARIYVLPRLAALTLRSILLPILILHAFRHLGLMFLAPGGIYHGIPGPFAYPAAFGDLTQPDLGIVRHAQEHLSMVRYEFPIRQVPAASAELQNDHTGIEFQEIFPEPRRAKRRLCS